VVSGLMISTGRSKYCAGTPRTCASRDSTTGPGKYCPRSILAMSDWLTRALKSGLWKTEVELLVLQASHATTPSEWWRA